jgi:hypothetical protein
MGDLETGVLSAALSGAFGKAGEQRAGAKETRAKYAWADSEAQRLRAENLAKHGEATELQELRGEQQISALERGAELGVESARQTREQKRLEGVKADKGSLRAKMEVMGSSPENINKAMDFLDRGGELVTWTGKPGEPLSTSDVKNLSEAIDSMFPDETSEAKLAMFKTMEANRTTGVPGLPTRAAQAKETAKTAATEKAKQEMVSGTTSDLKSTLSANPTKAIEDFQKLYSKRPDLAEATLAQLEAEGGYGPELKAMRRVLAGKGVLPEGRGIIQAGRPATPQRTREVIATIPTGFEGTGEF